MAVIVGEGQFVVETVFKETTRQIDEIAKNLERGFNLALRDVERLESSLGRIERLTEGIELRPEFEEAVNILEQGLERARAQLGEPLVEGIQLNARSVIEEANEIAKSLSIIPKHIENIRAASAAGLIDTESAQREIERLSELFRNLGGETARERISLPIRDLSQEAIAAQRSIAELQRRVEALRQAAAQGLIPQVPASREIQAANNAIRELGGTTRRASLAVRGSTQEAIANSQALRRLQTQYNLINKTLTESAQKTAVLNRLQGQARLLGGDLTRGLANFSEAGRNATGIFGLFQRGAERANEVLGRFGLNMRDLNVILGSGFLSTAGPALAVLLGVTIVAATTKAFIALSKLGAEMQAFRDRLQAGFGDGARIIEEFAQGSAQGLGLTERAAIQLTGTIGNLFQSFGVGAELSARFGVDLAGAARIIQRTSFTTETYEQVLTKLKGSLTGNIEALREYGIAVNETSLRETARAHSIQLVAGEIDAATKTLLTFLFVTDQANQRQDEFNKTTESTLTEQEKLAAAWEELKTTIGEDLTPLFRDLVVAGQEVVVFLGDLYDAVKTTLGPLADLSFAISDLLNLPEVGELLFGPKSEEAFAKFAQGIGALQEEISAFGLSGLFGSDTQTQIDEFREKTNQLFDDFVEGKINADQFFTILAAGLDISPQEAQRQYEAFFNAIARERPELEKYREELFKTTFAQKEAEEAARAHQQELRNQPEFLKRLVDAYEKLNDVIEDNAKRLQDAQEAVRDARIEGRKSVQDALEDLDEARVEGAKDIIKAERNLQRAEADRIKAITKARKNLQEAEEDRIEAISDAREALRDAEEEGREDIQDAEEALRDARIDAAKRVDDAERKLADARRQRTDQIFDAQLSLEQALRQGDVFAERSAALALSRAKRSKGVQDAQRALDEARIEGAEKVAEAQEKLAEAVEEAAEKVADAREKLVDTIEDQNERVAEAAERLADTIETQDERVADSAERLAEVRERAKDRILDAQEKLDDAEEKAIERLEEAKEKLREVRDENEKRLNEAIDKVNELEGEWTDVNEEVAHLRKQISALKRELADLFTSTPLIPEAALIPGFGGAQHGGFFRKGHPLLVGEAGPELFIPDTSGTVVSNDQLIQALKQMTGGRGGDQNITVVDSGDPEATAFAVAHRIMAGVNN